MGSIDPTLDIGTGGAIHTSPEPSPEPVFLTNWKIVGNSEVHGNELWSCGEYNSTDGKYHILVQPQGGNIADIALTEPLRMRNNVADTIEFPSSVDGKALVTRNLMYDTLDDKIWQVAGSRKVIISQYWNPYQKELSNNNQVANILVEGYTTYSYTSLATQANAGAAQSAGSSGSVCLYDDGYIPEIGYTPTQTFYDAIVGKHILLELATPTTELVDAPQIEEAESYTCVISPGAKAVEWSSFTTNSE